MSTNQGIIALVGIGMLAFYFYCFVRHIDIPSTQRGVGAKEYVVAVVFSAAVMAFAQYLIF